MEVASPPAPAYRPRSRGPRARKPTELGATDLTVRSIWQGFKGEAVALSLLCLFLMFEYLRPQQMFKFIDVIPWGMTTILLATLGALTVRGSAGGPNFLDGLCALFLMIVVMSMFTAYDPSVSMSQWLNLASLSLMYFCVRAVLTSPNRLLLFMIFFSLVCFKYSQFSARAFAFGRYGASGSGWFRNSGELAMLLAGAFFVSLCLLLALKPYIKSARRWWLLMAIFPGTALLSVLNSGSRAGQLGLVVAAVLMMIKPPQLVKKIVSLVAFAGIVVLVMPESQKDRFREAGDDNTSVSRLAYLEIGKKILADNPQGIGYNNWAAYYKRYYFSSEVFNRVEVSHNSYLDSFVELGHQGGIIFIVLLLAAFGMNLRTQWRLKRRSDRASVVTRSVARGMNLSLLSTCIAAGFMSVLFYPVFWLTFAITSAAYHVSVRATKGKAATDRTKLKQNRARMAVRGRLVGEGLPL